MRGWLFAACAAVVCVVSGASGAWPVAAARAASGEQWGFVDGFTSEAPWHWADSELQCYRDLAARRQYERRQGGSADIFGINCVLKTWK